MNGTHKVDGNIVVPSIMERYDDVVFPVAVLEAIIQLGDRATWALEDALYFYKATKDAVSYQWAPAGDLVGKDLERFDLHRVLGTYGDTHWDKVWNFSHLINGEDGRVLTVDHKGRADSVDDLHEKQPILLVELNDENYAKKMNDYKEYELLTAEEDARIAEYEAADAAAEAKRQAELDLFFQGLGNFNTDEAS